MRVIRIRWVSAIAALCCGACTAVAADASRGLIDVYATLANQKFVDLTHTFGPKTPHWKGFGEEKVVELYTIKKDGFLVQQFTHVGQWGTHIDAPAHFHEGLRTIDQIPLQQMVLPLVVIDVHDKVARNPDYTLKVEDINNWETRHGPIPERAFVAMRTDWSKRSGRDYVNMREDGQHTPGPCPEVVRFLVEERDLHGFGTETIGTDAGQAFHFNPPYPAHYYMHGKGRYGLQCLANLDLLPPTGSVILAAPLKIRRGSGSPLRVLALVPRAESRA